MVKKLFVPLILVWSLFVIFVGVSSGKNIFQNSKTDLYFLNSKKVLVENDFLGRLSYNKAGLYFNKYLDNFFAGLDPNYFFFGGHPREVPGGNNDIKISYWLIPLFFLGIYGQFVRKEKLILEIYLISLFLVSWFSIDSLWWILVSFIYLTIFYPVRLLWKK